MTNEVTLLTYGFAIFFGFLTSFTWWLIFKIPR